MQSCKTARSGVRPPRARSPHGPESPREARRRKPAGTASAASTTTAAAIAAPAALQRAVLARRRRLPRLVARSEADARSRRPLRMGCRADEQHSRPQPPRVADQRRAQRAVRAAPALRVPALHIHRRDPYARLRDPAVGHSAFRCRARRRLTTCPPITCSRQLVQGVGDQPRDAPLPQARILPMARLRRCRPLLGHAAPPSPSPSPSSRPLSCPSRPLSCLSRPLAMCESPSPPCPHAGTPLPAFLRSTRLTNQSLDLSDEGRAKLRKFLRPHPGRMPKVAACEPTSRRALDAPAPAVLLWVNQPYECQVHT